MDTAFYYYTCITDLVRKGLAPRIKEPAKGLYRNYIDFVNECKLRYLGIKGEYPDAEFIATDSGVSIFVQGVMVYEHYIVYIDQTPVKVPDDDEVDVDDYNEK